MSEYERRGEQLGRADPKNYPKLHSGHSQHQRHVNAIAAACREVDLESSLQRSKGGILACGWAEDVTGEHKLTKVRIVKNKLDVCMRMVDLSVVTSKIGLHKVQQMRESALRFAGNRPELQSVLLDRVQVWVRFLPSSSSSVH